MKNISKYFIFMSCILFSLEGNAIHAASTYAAQQIQNYLSENPLSNKDVFQIKKSALKQINTLKTLSSHEIVELVSTTQPDEVNLPSVYPVHSTLLSPGLVRPRKIKMLFSAPIFIVGDDGVSKRWLGYVEDKLIQLHAKGFVVNIQSAVDLKKLQTQFPKLELIPMPGNALAAWLKLFHYPVLVSSGTIQQ